MNAVKDPVLTAVKLNAVFLVEVGSFTAKHLYNIMIHILFIVIFRQIFMTFHSRIFSILNCVL